MYCMMIIPRYQSRCKNGMLIALLEYCKYGYIQCTFNILHCK